MEKDPLDEIMTKDSGSSIKLLLASLLKQYKVQINDIGETIYSEDFFENADWKKITLYFLAKKAMTIKNIKGSKETCTIEDISNATLVPSKNVSKRFSRELKNVVEKKDDGYFIPNNKLIICKKLLNRK